LSIKLWGIPIIEIESLIVLLFRFALNMFFVTILIRGIYYRLNKRSGYLFVLFTFNVLIFFLASILIMVKIEVGFAFGVFAVFSIIRYRTRQIPIREMTFLFVSIIIAIINSTVTATLNLAEVVFANLVILVISAFTEQVWEKDSQLYKNVVYEKIELITPEKREELLKDLRKRTGLDIIRIDITDINFLRDTATIRVFYREKRGDHGIEKQ
jgi:hypothetical protein